MRNVASLGILAIASMTFFMGLTRNTDAGPGGVPERVAMLEEAVADLEDKIIDLQAMLACVGNTSDHQNIYFDGCNVHVRNGTGGTESWNGFGNLIVGYDEDSATGPGAVPFVCSDGTYQDAGTCTGNGEIWAQAQKTGSHNLVVGSGHSYTRAAGVVFGGGNAVNRFAATVTGGYFNVASGPGANASGGLTNRAIGAYASVSGGDANWSIGDLSSISGGSGGRASGAQSSISGGWNNASDAQYSSISGGRDGITAALGSSISGGNMNRTFEGEDLAGTFASISGGIENETHGAYASVSGGFRNQANGASSTIGGGSNRTVPDSFDWRAGDLFEDD
jgi:hypothetical protein